MDVSVIIVSYNTKEVIRNCIRSIYNQTEDVEFEVIAVDNASEDGSVQMIRDEFPEVIIIENSKNIGFGCANNVGAAKARGNYLFFLNPDCLLLNNAVFMFYQFIVKNNKDGSIGALGGILLDNNMNVTSSYQKFPRILDTIYYYLKDYSNAILRKPTKQNWRINYIKSTDSMIEVEFVSGADLFVPARIFQLLNGFDENFFLYFEETDLQKRMEYIDLKRFIIKEPQIIHLQGVSFDRKERSLKAGILFKDSMYKYFKKHYSSVHYSIFYLFVTPLLLVPLLIPGFPAEDKKSYWKMLVRNFRF